MPSSELDCAVTGDVRVAEGEAPPYLDLSQSSRRLMWPRWRSAAPSSLSQVLDAVSTATRARSPPLTDLHQRVRSRLYTQVSGRGGATRLKRVPPLSNFAHVPRMRRLLLLGWQSSGTPPCDRSKVHRRPQTSQPPTDPTDSWSADPSPRNYTRRSCARYRMILKSDYTIKEARIRVVVF